MKCLSLRQPYASLVATGVKRVESRSWATSYRGSLAIHASKTFPRACRDLCEEEPFASCLAAGGFGSWRDLPLGSVLCVVTLVDCRSTSCNEDGTPNPDGLWDPEWLDELTDREWQLGNYDPGRWGWFLRDVRPLPEPVPAVGALGLWEFDPGRAAAGQARGIALPLEQP